MTSDAVEPGPHWLHDPVDGGTFSLAQKLMLFAGVVVAVAICWVASTYISATAIRGHSASLFMQGATLMNLVAVVAGFAGAVGVSLLAVGRVRVDAALFCGAAGLVVFRARGGGAGEALRTAGGTGAYPVMAAELAVLSAMLLAGAFLVHLVLGKNPASDDANHDHAKFKPESLDQKLLCTGTCAVVMTVFMMILCRSDLAGQAFWAVFVCSWGASACAFRFVPVNRSVWLWISPLVAGLAGYVYTWFYGSSVSQIGVSTGLLGALARPVPLDYATAGVMGALLAYWTGRHAHAKRADEAAGETTGETEN